MKKNMQTATESLKRGLDIPDEGFYSQLKRGLDIPDDGFHSQLKRGLDIPDEGFHSQLKRGLDIPDDNFMDKDKPFITSDDISNRDNFTKESIKDDNEITSQFIGKCAISEEIDKDPPPIKDKCKYPKCSFKINKDYAPYCGKHKLQFLTDKIIKDGKRPCSQNNRKCTNVLEPDYPKNTCQDCLLKIQMEDNKRRNGKIKNAPEYNDKGEKFCHNKNCNKYFPVEDFIGDNGLETITCKECRKKNKVADHNRDPEKRKESRAKHMENPINKEIYKEHKRMYVAENIEKIREMWKVYRALNILKNYTEYLKKNSKYSQDFRNKNPEKIKEYNKNCYNSIKIQYDIYKRSATQKQLSFEISTLQEFNDIVIRPCRYCGIIQERGFNGIDKINPFEGYLKSNIDSCCKTCNMMKGTFNEFVFIKKVIHILYYNEIIKEGSLYPEVCRNTKRATFNNYKNRANDRGIHFELSKEEFDMIVSEKCYLCGKENSEIHKNGIDRLNNAREIGYTLENSRPCCSECNFFKKNYSYEYIFLKMQEIYLYSKNKVLNNPDILKYIKEEDKNNEMDIFDEPVEEDIDENIYLDFLKKNNFSETLNINSRLKHVIRLSKDDIKKKSEKKKEKSIEKATEIVNNYKNKIK